MPTIESRIDAEARAWRDEVDAAFDRIDWAARRRHRRTRRYLLIASPVLAAAVVVIALVLTGVLTRDGGTPAAGRSADCAAPDLRLAGQTQPQTSPLPVTPGQRLSVTGRFYVEGCQDNPGAPPPRTLSRVNLVLITADGHRTPVAVAHPHGSAGTFRIDVVVPAAAPDGPATLTDGDHLTRSVIRLIVS